MPDPTDPTVPAKPPKPRRPRKPSTPKPDVGAPDPNSPPASLERALGPTGDTPTTRDKLDELDEKPEGLSTVVELDALDADELPRPEDDRDPDPADLHPYAARFHSRGFARGHVCPSCSRSTSPVEPGHTYCGPCGSHWTLAPDQA